MTIATPWAGVRVLARYAGEVDPYQRANALLFRGEEVFAPDVQGQQRWSKPSPEPLLDAAFQALVIAAIRQAALPISAMVAQLAHTISATCREPPLLVAILRAGVPASVLLADCLSRRFDAEVPVVALSLFAGLGWDAAALALALQTYPDRPVWFVDGWTGRGGVAHELRLSYQRWLTRGMPDFTHGRGPDLAVLCDPAGMAQAAGTRTDYFIPAACFTAPETLGFSRGFVTDEPGMFAVYGYPPRFLQPAYHQAWMQIVQTDPRNSAVMLPQSPQQPSGPVPGIYRIHSNEVARALINRNPQEVLFRDNASTVTARLAPIQALCAIRNIPVRYGCGELAAWGTLVAAHMQGDNP